MNKHQQKKLLEHADRLSKFRPTKKQRFDMSVFFKENKDIKGHLCGTSACSAGYFCLWNPRDKLKLITNTIGFTQGYLTFTDSDSQYENSAFALLTRFGLTNLETDYLFYGPPNLTPKQVAKRIREVVAYHTKGQVWSDYNYIDSSTGKATRREDV